MTLYHIHIDTLHESKTTRSLTGGLPFTIRVSLSDGGPKIVRYPRNILIAFQDDKWSDRIGSDRVGSGRDCWPGYTIRSDCEREVAAQDNKQTVADTGGDVWMGPLYDIAGLKDLGRTSSAHVSVAANFSSSPSPSTLCFHWRQFLGLFVCLFAGLRRNYSTVFHISRRKGGKLATEDTVRFWRWSGLRLRLCRGAPYVRMGGCAN